MNIKTKNVLVCLFLRPFMGVPLGIWIAVSVVYYWWPMSRISVPETQNKVFKTQLRISQNVMQQLSIESAAVYEVPVIPDAIGNLCETVHVALVCMGKCTRLVTPMLKSLLHHRQNPLHFHLVVDGASHHTISMLFHTWDLPDVRSFPLLSRTHSIVTSQLIRLPLIYICDTAFIRTARHLLAYLKIGHQTAENHGKLKYTCYNAQSRLSQVRRIPNRHYSGIYGLMKLLFPEVLPDTLDRVVVLDSDLTFVGDIAELWSMFRNMTDEQLIGLVENESNWYLEQTKRWPALGRGYNTGVMLLDLKKIRTNTNWTSLWETAVNDNIKRMKQLQLADQDVINAILKKNPRFVFNITCQYNVQMSEHSIAKTCYGENRNNIKIIHWNSPAKDKISIRDPEFFRNVYRSYVNLDGNLLREKLHRCSQAEPVTYKMNHSDLCLSFRAAQRVKLRTHVYYMEYNYSDVDNFDVTLALQLSTDRLQFLERLVKYWEGPLSVAIYLSDCEVGKLESFIRDWSDTLKSRSNIGYHLVFKHDGVHYPVNYLRNVAVEHVSTPYVFLMDVDFVPMAGLYEHLRRAIQLVNPYPQKKCLVVAAFETQRYRLSRPRSKAALLAQLAGGRVVKKGALNVAPFRAREWPRGHRTTNYTRWATATAPYEVEWQSVYKPFLVVHRSVPKYDTRFSGFEWTKVSHSVELRAVGYRAVVLPGAFVLHTPHAPSPDITAFRADPHYRVCLKLLKQEFMDDLKRKYNVSLGSFRGRSP